MMLPTFTKNSLCLMSGLVDFLVENSAREAWEEMLSKVLELDPVSSKWEDAGVRRDLGLSFRMVKRQLRVGELFCFELRGVMALRMLCSLFAVLSSRLVICWYLS